MAGVCLWLPDGVWQRHQRVTNMKLEITRGLLLVGALGVCTLAAAAWREPGSTVVGALEHGSECRVPLNAQTRQDVRPDHDLLLFLFGMSQGGAAGLR
ncbi:MAG: hypothetical protein GAK43_01088 [Stenotrophomonas maltophilia]|nr:MAG: hypothetical protein GAK43_01088 [Stenotrophomonas maltophilia]